jgi:hypothetical protein
MSSPFLYRLRVLWSRNNARGQEIIPVYAFKSGGNDSQFIREVNNLETLNMIADGANGARILTVCTFHLYAYRALENRDVERFELSIKDTRIATSPTTERPTVATITSRDMKGGQITPFDASGLQMSCESGAVTNILSLVSLSFFDSDDGPVFTRT